MNERVSIKEGGLTRELSPIDKVKVNNTDETQSIWVSKDDMHTGTLYATENGIYIASEDGYDAYDEVLIRVTDESYDGGNAWKDVDPDVDRYTWDDTTYQDYKIDPDSFDDKFNDPTKWEDEDLGDNLDYKYNDGNSISGIDPETGKPVEYSVDEEGFLEEENLPWMIEITRLPDRTEFYDGHRIVFSGIEVSSVTDIDGEDVYKPIPYNELVFPVTIASGDDSGVKKVITDGTDLTGNVYGNSVGIGTLVSRYTTPETIVLGITGDTPSVYAFWRDGAGVSNAITYVWVAHTPWTVETGRKSAFGIITYRRFISGNLTFYNDKPYYIYSTTATSERRMNDFAPSSTQWNPEEAAMTASECPTIMEQSIPVQWISPDGSMLEDSYTITVLPNPSV